MTKFLSSAPVFLQLMLIMAECDVRGVENINGDAENIDIQECETELANLSGRVDSLESRTAFLEDPPFSTTTKLEGEVVFGLAQEFTSDNDNQAVFQDRVRLNFVSSFTGNEDSAIALTVSPFKQSSLTAQLSQEQLARDIGVAVSTIRRWEIGQAEPTMTVLQMKSFCEAVNHMLDEDIFNAEGALWQDFVPTVSPYVDFQELRELLSAIAETDITEFTLKSDDFELTLRSRTITNVVDNAGSNTQTAIQFQPSFPGHIPGNPLMPGVLQIEAMAQVGGTILMQIPELAGRAPFIGATGSFADQAFDPSLRIEIVIEDDQVDMVVDKIIAAARTEDLRTDSVTVIISGDVSDKGDNDDGGNLLNKSDINTQYNAGSVVGLSGDSGSLLLVFRDEITSDLTRVNPTDFFDLTNDGGDHIVAQGDVNPLGGLKEGDKFEIKLRPNNSDIDVQVAPGEIPLPKELLFGAADGLGRDQLVPDGDITAQTAVPFIGQVCFAVSMALFFFYVESEA